jgi:uncharacterized membrane protein
MTEYLILFVLFAVSLVIVFLLVRMLLQVKRVEDTAEVNVVELKPSEAAAPEAVLEDVKINVEEEREEAPQ